MTNIQRYSTFTFGDMTVSYLLDTSTSQIGLLIHPVSVSDCVEMHRTDLRNVREVKNYTDGIGVGASPSFRVEPLVAYSIVGSVAPSGLASGITQKNNLESDLCRFVDQSVDIGEFSTTVTTVSLNERTGMKCIHELKHCRGDTHLSIVSQLRNEGSSPQVLTMAQGCNLGFLSPYAESTQSQRLCMHRMRGGWSTEGRVVSETLETIGLESSWSHHALRCERFGQAGSVPNMRWFPIIALEDKIVGVFWGCKLACPTSWQIEVTAKDDYVSISGGFADHEFGHWTKILQVHETLTLPTALLSTSVSQDFLEFSQRIPLESRVGKHMDGFYPGVIFNDWCSVWGATSQRTVQQLLPFCKELGVRYFVIDAGWYADEGGLWAEGQGDWIPGTSRYPEGLAKSCAQIRKGGLVPGIWFEPEVVGPSSELWEHHNWLLHKDGAPIQVGSRRFLDLRKKEVVDYLVHRIEDIIITCGMGYLKLDVNESVGIGVDGAESLGEGLRNHMQGLTLLLQRLGEDFPDLLIENCAAGGLRVEPHMVSLTSINSATDAHEISCIPLIVANEYHMVRPRQLLVWTVLRASDDSRRMYYTLSSAFLGIMCLSGDIDKLQDWQKDILKYAIRLQESSQKWIRNAHIKVIREKVDSYLEPEGYQVVLFQQKYSLLVVVHSFEREINSITFSIGDYDPTQIEWKFCEDSVEIKLLESGMVQISNFPAFSGLVAKIIIAPGKRCTLTSFT